AGRGRRACRSRIRPYRPAGAQDLSGQFSALEHGARDGNGPPRGPDPDQKSIAAVAARDAPGILGPLDPHHSKNAYRSGAELRWVCDGAGAIAGSERWRWHRRKETPGTGNLG